MSKKMVRILSTVVLFSLVLSLATVAMPQTKANAAGEDITVTGGVLLWEYPIAGEDTYTQAKVVDDLDGDSLPDILIDASVGSWESVNATLTAISGVDGTTLWDVAISGERADVYAQAVGDLDGDGKADVLVRTDTGPWPTRISTLTAKKGTNGSDIWPVPNRPTITGQDAVIGFWEADDLDGGGKTDVMLYTRIYGTPDVFTVIAKNGSIGNTIWETVISADYVSLTLEPVDDLDGDSLTDVLLKFTEETSPSPRTFTVEARKGTNGTILWDESIAGSNAQGGAGTIDDLDDDGKTDSIVYLRHMDAPDGLAVVKAVKGTNGSTLWEDSLTGWSGVYAYPRVVEDLDGDNKQDVLVEIHDVGNVKRVRAYSGAGDGGSPEVLWDESYTGDDPQVYSEVVGDMDFDGLADILITKTQGPWDGERTNLIKALKGVDGTALWEFPFDGLRAQAYVVPIYDLTGDGKTDVVLSTEVGSIASGNASVIAKKGSDGTNLWDDGMSGENINLEPLGADDLNGDDISEVRVYTATGPWESRTATFTVKNGVDGIDLWEESVTGDSAETRSQQLGSLDCDDKTDILLQTVAGPSGNKTYSAMALRGKDGLSFWEAESNAEINVAYWSGDPENRISYDLNGDSRPDVVLLNSNNVCAISAAPCVTSSVTLTANPLSITANGISTSLLTATVEDEYGGPVPDGTDVVFTTDYGILGSSTITKQTTGGVATAIITSESSTEIIVATVKAAANGASDTTAIFFIPAGGPGVKESLTETINGSGTIPNTPTGGDVTIDATGEHTITIAEYEGNPGGTPNFRATGDYYDVHLDDDTGVNSVTIEFCPANPHHKIRYWDGSNWILASNQIYSNGCIIVTVTENSVPSLSDLTGLPFALEATDTPSAVPTLSQWGMIGMVIMLSALLVWSVRRRWVVSAGKS